ncbi:P-loop NTPase family protein, partial [Staphylococcus epidermidis]|uniref:ABC transporter ATP-binding protein n=1 Tax=Staphylococcus epidermidis TaxID=1282 RepID=UPI00164362AB
EKYKKSWDNKVATIRNHTVGFLFQNFKLIQNNTILQNVTIPLIYNPIATKQPKHKLFNPLQHLPLHNKQHLLPNKLSRPQQQPLPIPTPIINQPNFLIPHQPTPPLHSKTSKHIIHFFLTLNKQKPTTIIILTHHPHVPNNADPIIHILHPPLKHQHLFTHH